jgi:hypothetical protein
LYVPFEVSLKAGALERDLAETRWTPNWTTAMEACVATTRELFERGRFVCDGVGGRLRFELRLTWHGGMCVLDRVARGRDALLVKRPKLERTDVPVLLWRAARWGGAAA